MVILENMWQEDWLLYHKVVFDGINRLIIVNPNETQISVKTDIYSNWKEWVRVRDNAKYLPALRTIGGDDIGGGKTAGDIYFTINNWRILLTEDCTIDGVIYSDNFSTPFTVPDEAKIITNVVSNLVQNSGFNGTVQADLSGAAQSVWDYLLADADTPGSVGERLGKLLTVAKYLGLK